MVHIPQELRQKWDAKSKKYIFVGYGNAVKGYRLMDQNTKKVIVSRDVIFLEDQKCVEEEQINEPLTHIVNMEKTTEDIENDEEISIEEVTREEEQKDEEQQKSRTGREVKTPNYLKDYEVYSAYYNKKTYQRITQKHRETKTGQQLKKKSIHTKKPKRGQQQNYQKVKMQSKPNGYLKSKTMEQKRHV